MVWSSEDFVFQNSGVLKFNFLLKHGAVMFIGYISIFEFVCKFQGALLWEYYDVDLIWRYIYPLSILLTSWRWKILHVQQDIKQ